MVTATELVPDRTEASAARTDTELEACWKDDFEPISILDRARQHREGGDDIMFVIHRSSNTNTVVYRGNHDTGIQVFWMMFEKTGEPTEDLNAIERNTAYGTSVKKISDSHYQVQLSALKSKIIDIKWGNGQWVATTDIGEETDQRLLAVHVEMAKSFIPSVAYIEIFGGGGTYEVIEKVKGSSKRAQAKAIAAIKASK